MRWLAVSVAVHALALWLIVREDTSRARAPAPATPDVEPAPIEIAVIELASGGGGAPANAAVASTAPRRSSRALSVHGPRARARDPWSRLSIRTEAISNSAGVGEGTGHGDGRGTGLGFGAGTGMRVVNDVPPPPVPVPPPPSKARAARLIWPNRDVEVIDDSYLFVARVTVDEDGAVVGARMLTMRPGSRAEHAANAIWQFRYEPALDEHGVPVRSTFEQPFQVR